MIQASAGDSCHAPTGSAERVAVYAARVAAGLPMFSALDSTATIPPYEAANIYKQPTVRVVRSPQGINQE